MAIDMKAFHEMFFAECEEFLDFARIQLESEAADISELHRCAHSIKGGADTFGFADMVALASELERLLQRVKDGHSCMDVHLGAVMRKAFVVLHEQLSALRSGQPTEREVCAAMIAQLARLQTNESGPASTEVFSASPMFDLRFMIGRLVVGSEVLVDDMLVSLARLGEVVSMHRPQGSDSDQFWHIRVASTHTDVELRAVLERVAEPDSLSIAQRIGDGATDVRDTVDTDIFSKRNWKGADVATEAADVMFQPLPLTDASDEAQRHSYVIFLVGEQLYAVQAGTVTETRPHGRVTWIAGLPNCVLGVIPLEGEFVPVLDMRVLLEVDSVGVSAPAVQLCVNVDGCRAALAVDDVRDVLLLARDHICPVPSQVVDVARHVVGFAVHAGEVLVVLDLRGLFAAAHICPARVVALESRLEALNATLPRVASPQIQTRGAEQVSFDTDGGRRALVDLLQCMTDRAQFWAARVEDESAVTYALSESPGHAYDELLDFLEDAMGTGRAALLLARDLDHGLRYPEQQHSLVVLLLGWIAEMLTGLDQYIEHPVDQWADHVVDRGVSSEEVGPHRSRKSRQRSVGPLPKIGGRTRFDRSIADEWEFNKK